MAQEISSMQQMPPFQLMELSYGLISTQALYVVAKLGIADLLSDGPKTAGQLAALTGCDADFLQRLLRFLVSKGVFAHSAGRFELNDVGSMLRADAPRSARPMALYFGSAWNWNTWGNLLGSVTKGKTAFDLVHGAGFFEYIDTHADDAAIFSQYMDTLVRDFAKPVLMSYDFSQKKHLIDIGGGHGALLLAALEANTGLRGTLFDLPKVVNGARAVVEGAGMQDRCTLIEGSFFESVPSGGDVYLLSNILHDWDNEDCLRILKNCRTAMGSDSSLLVCEAILPDGDFSPIWLFDLVMLALTGGRQRTVAQFSALFQKAGLKLGQLNPLGLIEALPS
ncbi:MAG TPA: methyltransferase [Candidatus Acidoferrum sp.]